MGMLDKIRGQSSGPHAHHGHPAQAHGPPGTVRDPVCGMWVDPQKAAARSEYQGRTIHFCSPGCKASFDASPERYQA